MVILHFSREVTSEEVADAVKADPALSRHPGIANWLVAMRLQLDAVAIRRRAGTTSPEDERPLSVGPSDDPRELRLWWAVEAVTRETSPDGRTS